MRRTSRERVIDSGLVATHGVLHSLVGRKVDRMRRPWESISDNTAELPVFWQDLPAPTITLDMPRHKLVKPSPAAIWYVLRSTPV